MWLRHTHTWLRCLPPAVGASLLIRKHPWALRSHRGVCLDRKWQMGELGQSFRVNSSKVFWVLGIHKSFCWALPRRSSQIYNQLNTAVVDNKPGAWSIEIQHRSILGLWIRPSIVSKEPSTYPINAITAAVNQLRPLSCHLVMLAGRDGGRVQMGRSPTGCTQTHGFLQASSKLRLAPKVPWASPSRLFHRVTRITWPSALRIRCQLQVPLLRWSQIQSLLEPLGRLTLNTSAVPSSGLGAPGPSSWFSNLSFSSVLTAAVSITPSLKYCEPSHHNFSLTKSQIKTNRRRYKKYFCTFASLPLRNVQKHLLDRPGYYQNQSLVLPAVPVSLWMKCMHHS